MVPSLKLKYYLFALGSHLSPQSQTDCTYILLPSQVSQYNKVELPTRFKSLRLCSQYNLILKCPLIATTYNTGSERNALCAVCFWTCHKNKRKIGSVAPPLLYLRSRFICKGQTMINLFVKVNIKTFYRFNLLANVSVVIHIPGLLHCPPSESCISEKYNNSKRPNSDWDRLQIPCWNGYFNIFGSSLRYYQDKSKDM